MRDTALQSRGSQKVLKTTAIACGSILLAASVYSESAALNLDAMLKFISSNVQSTTQLQWVFGIIFLSGGIFFNPTLVDKKRSFYGPKELTNNSYVLYLVDQYQIEKNLVLDQLIVRDKIFSNIDDALAFAHEIECSSEISTPLRSSNITDAPSNLLEEEGSLLPDQGESDFGGLKNPFLDSKPVQASASPKIWDESKRRTITLMVGAVLFTTVLGGLYYANSHSLKSSPQSVVSNTAISSLSDSPSTDQVVSGSISSLDAPSAGEPKESGNIRVATPINDRWIGLWVAEGDSKQKLLVTSTLLKLNNEEFNWTGIRPKGIVQCCLAFYEGATTKSELLARISGAQDQSVTLKPEAQKTLALINGLSDGNFKRIVFVDPYLKKYFFIYDQNYVYRISRDLGDKVDVVVEPFKKQE
jgi:hypothetical protein